MTRNHLFDLIVISIAGACCGVLWRYCLIAWGIL